MDTLGPILIGAHAASAIIAGHYAGLWTTLGDHPGKKWTIAELADAADCKERFVRSSGRHLSTYTTAFSTVLIILVSS